MPRKRFLRGGKTRRQTIFPRENFKIAPKLHPKHEWSLCGTTLIMTICINHSWIFLNGRKMGHELSKASEQANLKISEWKTAGTNLSMMTIITTQLFQQGSNLRENLYYYFINHVCLSFILVINMPVCIYLYA